MEEYFEYFLKRMGPSVHRREVPLSTRDKYKDRLPSLLISHWEKYGWSGYGDGIFWTVDPAEYDVFIPDWLAASDITDPDTFLAIARSAFGDLYLWQEKTGSRLTICSVYGSNGRRKLRTHQRNPVFGVKFFLPPKKQERIYFTGSFRSALKTLDPIQPEELFGTAPPPAIVAPADLKHLQKVKTIEHLTFLSQLAPLTDWGFPDIDSL